jgi:DNA-directed RNA polymerase II subunit RPB1
VNLEKKRADYKDGEDPNISLTDAKVVIHNGELLSGIVDSKTVGKTASGLIHICMLEKGMEQTRVFISSIQKLINHWLMTFGHTVGISDTIA